MSEPPSPYPGPGQEPQQPYPGQPPYRGPEPPPQMPPYPGGAPQPPYPGGPQQPYQGPFQYAQGPYNPYGGSREHPQGTTVLVLGILSLVGGFLCGIFALLGPVAWIMGNNAIAEIDRNPMQYTNRGAVQGGRICGIIATVLMALGIVLFILLIAASGA